MNARVEKHLKALMEKGAFGDLSFERVEESWLIKENLFSDQAANLKLEEVESLSSDGDRAFLALTFSGSLLAFFADQGEGAGLEYSSIKFREDVPSMVMESGVALADSVRRGSPCGFESRMLRKTSPVYRIMAAPADMKREEQNKRVSQGMIFLTNGFIKINKTYLPGSEGKGPDHFTGKTMASYLAGRHGLTQKETRSILDDYVALLETGVLMGERVPLGKIGRLYAELRPPRQARIGRNPATGEEMTLPAKPARHVPKISFSGAFKERLERLDVPEDPE